MVDVPAAKKKWGQHFLRDSAVLARWGDALAAVLQPGHRVVEIGPGRGALTEVILSRLGLDQPLRAVEIDRDCLQYLGERFSHDSRLVLDAGDVTRLSLPPGPTLVLGNLPYNISTPLLFHLLPYRQQVVAQIFMLQKEVVDRMVAAPHNRVYGRLSVMLQSYYEIETLFEVDAAAFQPVPKVMSAVVRMTPLAAAPQVDFAALEKVVALAFNQRRKQLGNSLRALFSPADLERCGVAPHWRAEDLSLTQYHLLALEAFRGGLQ